MILTIGNRVIHFYHCPCDDHKFEFIPFIAETENNSYLSFGKWILSVWNKDTWDGFFNPVLEATERARESYLNVTDFEPPKIKDE